MMPANITTLASIKREAQSRALNQRQGGSKGSGGPKKSVASNRKRTSPPKKQQPGRVQSTQRYMCSECGVVTPTQLVLDVHMQRVHKPGRPRFKVGRNQPFDSTVAPQADVVDRSRPLDATREWSSAYRDHGQFGSHASFDAMDDDSKP
jgi:hypothetical protein